jgi:tetratricopeptide (TPR) repeat protein
MSYEIQTLLDQARQARRERRPADARLHLQQAMRLCRENTDQLLLASALTALGQIERDLSNPAEALHHYEEAAAIYRAAGEELRYAHTIRHVGDIHREEKRPGPAGPCYRTALEIYRAHPEPHPLDVANAIRGYALLKEETGETLEALALWKEARELYAQAQVEAGVAESTRRIALLER